MAEIEVHRLLHTDLLTVRDVQCAGTCRHRSPEECTSATHLVFPYRGVYTRHVGGDQTIADANHVLFFNANESYQVSHPVTGGDRSLDIVLSGQLLRELARSAILASSSEALRFGRQNQRIDPATQAMVASLRYRMVRGAVDPLDAETSVLALISRSLGPRTSRIARATFSRRRLADRVKLLLAGDLARRWTLADIASKIGGSPVYLTQVFRRVEGLPLYRYHLQLRLARALDLLPQCDDIAALGLELGFSSHSHFTFAFRQAYSYTPSAFKRMSIRGG